MYVIFLRAGVAGKHQIFGIKLHIIICVCLSGQRSSEHSRTTFDIGKASAKPVYFTEICPILQIKGISVTELNSCNLPLWGFVKSYTNYCLSTKGTTGIRYYFEKIEHMYGTFCTCHHLMMTKVGEICILKCLFQSEIQCIYGQQGFVIALCYQYTY